ncbi:MAG TPA: YbaB/EbfC family nucleoid-associated protein [Candidatus Binataceae bacterium]|jgi:DNA-binding YbaB/EbfC family protein|nr:YbaB/EbfC family nucleoid-associated protein [Candidatus Binataceae bacterium]
MSDFDSPPFDLGALMKQAQALQEKLKQTQDEVADKTVEASAGGGMVQVVADGTMRIRSVRIDPAILAANDPAMLQDLIVAGVNEGLRRAQEMITQEMSKLSPLGGMNIPGLFGGRS